jgi:phosphoribosyl-ATP pyrophosphohydrolase/phosphoribosyl-AMP cyclohydrolase
VVSLEKLWALVVQNEAGDTLALTLSNEKGIQKSIENNELWSLHPETGRLIPWQANAELISLTPHQEGYLAVVAGVHSSQAVTTEAKQITVQGDSTLDKLQKVIAFRNKERPEGSYTTHLFEKGVDKILKKTGEEAVEMLLARTDGELLYESADFIYHLFVLLEAKGLNYQKILEELEKRMK